MTSEVSEFWSRCQSCGETYSHELPLDDMASDECICGSRLQAIDKPDDIKPED
jgi:rRNA maturation endonuclease Nob1